MSYLTVFLLFYFLSSAECILIVQLKYLRYFYMRIGIMIITNELLLMVLNLSFPVDL